MDHEPTMGTVPLHLRIADDLRTKIDKGQLEPGDKLPPIRELSETWKCTAGTAREALAVLRAEGRITTGRGTPARVRRPAKRILLTPGWAQVQKNLVRESEERRQKTGAIELTTGTRIDQIDFHCDYKLIRTSYELSREFEIDQELEILQRRYEMTEKETGNRIAHSYSYIPKFLIEDNPELLDESNEPWPGGHQHQLYTVGIEIHRFARAVTAYQPTPGEQQKWGIESGTPMLRVRSKSIDNEYRVVEMSDATYPADRTEIGFFEYLRPLDEKSGNLLT